MRCSSACGKKPTDASSRTTSRKPTRSTVFCSTTLIKALRSSPYVRNSWPKRSAIWLQTTHFFSLTPERLLYGWRDILVVEGIGGFSARSHGHPWPTPPPMLLAHSWHIQGGKRSHSVATEATRCLHLAIS